MRGDQLLRLYPRAWRDRYGDEFLALVGERRLPARHVIDVVAGAIDAWLFRRQPAAAGHHESEGGAAVLQALREACQQSRPITRRDATMGAAVVIGLIAVLTLLGVALDRLGYDAAGEFILLFGFFVAVQVSSLWTYLKGRPAGVKAVMAGGPLVVVAALLAGTMWFGGRW